MVVSSLQLHKGPSMPHMAKSGLDWFNLSIVFVYLVGIVGFGCFAGRVRRRGGEGSHYFLAGNTLGWPVIGLAMFAANISTVHLVSFAETAYKYGLVFGNFEWMAGFTLVLLSLFFAPLYLRSRVPTLPDFLERRFNRHCRDWLTVISIFSAIVIHIGVALYTAAWCSAACSASTRRDTICGIDPDDVLHHRAGRAHGHLYHDRRAAGRRVDRKHPDGPAADRRGVHHGRGLLRGGRLVRRAIRWPRFPIRWPGWPIGVALQLAHRQLPHDPARAGDPSKQPWYGILLGYPVIGIWYWCCDQTIVQRVLAARDEKQARLGPLFCAFLKILPVFIFVLPGVMCVALVQQGHFGPRRAPADRRRRLHLHGHPHVALGTEGAGDRGHAGGRHANLFGRAELHRHAVRLRRRKRYLPKTTDHRLVLVGKITTVVGTVLAIVSSPIFGQKDTVFQALTDLICYVSPPITAVFLLGVFWKRASGRAAYLALVLGNVAGVALFALDAYRQYVHKLFWKGSPHRRLVPTVVRRVARHFLRGYRHSAGLVHRTHGHGTYLDARLLLPLACCAG